MSELESFGKLLIRQLNKNLEKELEIRNLINKYSKNNENSTKGRNQEVNSNGNKNSKWCN